MLDPRIYRAGFVAVALAVVVFAFSLENPQGTLHTNLAPEAFSGSTAWGIMNSLAHSYPDRTPGSGGDEDVATYVASALKGDNFSVGERTFSASTSGGSQTLETVAGVTTGLSNGTIAVVSSRDASGSPATAGLSGTAVMLELAQVLKAQSPNHSIMLISTSGSIGAAGAQDVAHQLAGRQVDAVLVLGDLAALHPSQPLIVPWSNGPNLPPLLLRNTLAAALSSQANLHAPMPSFAAQLARLMFPLTISPQGPFVGRGEPAVLLSLSGERQPAANEPVSQSQLSGVGAAVLQTVDALDGGRTLSAPSAYLVLDGKIVPFWAIRILVLALLLPVIIVAVDGIARARRRGHRVIRWTGWALAGAVPFVLAAVVIRLAKLASLIHAAPPGPVGAGAVPLHAAGVLLLALVALVLVLGFWVLRPICVRLARIAAGERGRAAAAANPADGAGPALLLVACLAAVLIWSSNPFSAGLLVLALHLWVWVVDPDLRIRRPAAAAMVLIGLIPPLLVLVYYVHAFSLSPVDVVWNGTLLIAGGQLGLVTAVLWSIVLGCLVSVAVIVVRSHRHHDQEADVITVRGPITYAGPGSLGGTESALRR